MHSPYFSAMFSGNFKEANEKHILLKCDYTALKEILLFIHHVDSDFSAGRRRIEPKLMRNLCITADMLDFPVIRNFCEAQMLKHPSVEMANVAHSLGLHDVMMAILERMHFSKVRVFILRNPEPLGPQLIFSKIDMVSISNGMWIKSRQCDPIAKKLSLDLEDIFKDVEEPLVDLNQEGPGSDVSLMATDCKGRLLYSNKALLSCVSEHFKKLFYGESESKTAIRLDAEYATLKQILSIVHRCNGNFHRNGYRIHPVLLYDMYVTASEDQLDIPMIKKFCCENLRDEWSSIAYDVAIKLGLSDVKSHLANTMSEYVLKDWMMNKSEALSYVRDGKEVVISSGDARELMFSADDIRPIVDRLR